MLITEGTVDSPHGHGIHPFCKPSSRPRLDSWLLNKLEEIRRTSPPTIAGKDARRTGVRDVADKPQLHDEGDTLLVLRLHNGLQRLRMPLLVDARRSGYCVSGKPSMRREIMNGSGDEVCGLAVVVLASCLLSGWSLSFIASFAIHANWCTPRSRTH